VTGLSADGAGGRACARAAMRGEVVAVVRAAVREESTTGPGSRSVKSVYKLSARGRKDARKRCLWRHHAGGVRWPRILRWPSTEYRSVAPRKEDPSTLWSLTQCQRSGYPSSGAAMLVSSDGDTTAPADAA
jgi:hypothetical protein